MRRTEGSGSGIVAQSCGLLGLVAGVWLASRYGEAAGLWMRVDPSAARVAGFVAILLLTLLGIALLGHLLKGLFRLAGLGPIDAVGGLLLGVVKMALILSLLLGAFETVNRSAGWVGERSYARAVLYKPVREVSRWVFPLPEPGGGEARRPGKHERMSMEKRSTALVIKSTGSWYVLRDVRSGRPLAGTDSGQLAFAGQPLHQSGGGRRSGSSTRRPTTVRPRSSASVPAATTSFAAPRTCRKSRISSRRTSIRLSWSCRCTARPRTTSSSTAFW